MTFMMWVFYVRGFIIFYCIFGVDCAWLLSVCLPLCVLGMAHAALTPAPYLISAQDPYAVGIPIAGQLPSSPLPFSLLLCSTSHLSLPLPLS